MNETYYRATCGENVLHGWLLPVTSYSPHRYMQVDGAGQTVYLPPSWSVEPVERPVVVS